MSTPLRSSADDTHLVLSYELLQVLRWMIEHEPENLKKLLVHALNRGLKHELAQAPTQKDMQIHLQEHVIDFFALLEALIHESIHEQETNQHLQRAMVPAINQLVVASCDETSVELSIAKATAAAENKTGENPKEVLCRELLRRWKPIKQHDAH